ncbi:MAG: transcriptional regulator NrdR, partial [Clostridia bacterium]|nr:transcriptional regulator NrdR [Clostridia bacterium]
TLPLIIIKKDGKRESYDRNKLLRGLLRSCEKRPVSINQLEKLIDDVEQGMRNSLAREVSSEHIGELVMDALKNLDEVAYVRFASVYRSFKDIDSFRQELELLETEKSRTEQ